MLPLLGRPALATGAQSVTRRSCLQWRSSARAAAPDGARAWGRALSSSAAQQPAAPTVRLTVDEAEPDPVEAQVGMTPAQVVAELDRFIVGQRDAKRAVAVALRTRYRRMKLPVGMRAEVVPKNILMVGPTGSGKTEIARRLAKLANAPFVKVEATKFTEVGFHGRDVDTIIRDLLLNSFDITKKRYEERLRGKAADRVEDQLLSVLVGPETAANRKDRESWRALLRSGELEDRSVTVNVPVKKPAGGGAGGGAGGVVVEGSGGVGINVRDLVDAMQRANGRARPTEVKTLPVKEARAALLEAELERQLEGVDLTSEAIRAAEQHGIVFIDELDKICTTTDYKGGDASAEGVQRDLLPLLEGCSVSTKEGNVNTDHILFIASGAFHTAKPSDLLPELQGRLPIRVELQRLTEADMFRILTEPETNLVRQQVALLATEGVEVEFQEDAVREMARFASEINSTVEHIGARRLHTVVERIMEDISFEAPDMPKPAKVLVTPELVRQRLAPLMQRTDLTKFIL